MSIDPDELKIITVKRERQIKEIEAYRDEQAILDEQNRMGKMGPYKFKLTSASLVMNKVWNRCLGHL